MRFLVLALVAMLNSPLILSAKDSRGPGDGVQKEEEEIIEVLEILEEYELLQDMGTQETYPEPEQRDEEETVTNPEKDRKIERKWEE
jgi:hypothetical protein